MKGKLIQILFITALVIGFWSCDKNRIIDQFKPIEKTSWNVDSIAHFSFEISDTLSQYNILLNVRNDIKYGYSNLWLFVSLAAPNNTVTKDTFELSLADATGKWLGQGFGGVRTRRVMYQRNKIFKNSGEYTISLQHGMREKTLKGITDIGCRIEKVEE